PAASANPSAMAIVMRLAITANLEFVAEDIPTIMPKDVITPEVIPNEKPLTS
ncbi:unnamed protein product, partial [marine sediment metagenome]